MAIPAPKNSKWKTYLEPAGSKIRPWLEGDLLLRYRKAAELLPDNPYYKLAYKL